MGAFANVLAAGPQPTTAWKSPLDLQQQESTVLHNRASAKSIEQETMLKQQEAARAEAMRKATMKAAKEAGNDPRKFVSIYHAGEMLVASLKTEVQNSEPPRSAAAEDPQPTVES